METEKFSMGWIPDLPDFRDYTVDTPVVQSEFQVADLKINQALAAENTKGVTAPALPAQVDLRRWCSPIEDQGRIGSCTANAGVGMLEYFQNRAFNSHIDASRLFLYKVTRNLLQWTGDTGAYLRTTMKAMAGFGICPEQYWPYSDAKTGNNGVPTDPFEREPSSFAYAFASNYKSLTYYRLDPPNVSGNALVQRIKTNLDSNLPCMFGFTVYNSIYSTEVRSTGKIPYPKTGDSTVGGHAVMIVGYDDAMKITNADAPATIGAFIIRNSWGSGWGDGGYGYLPYKYVKDGLARDFWSIASANFFNTNNFN